MSVAQKVKSEDDQADWRPTASIENLRQRAVIIQQIREFFFKRGVLDVETPLLCHSTIPDPYIESFKVPLNDTQTCYLQTSPEFAMKRLLAAGSGPIFQLCKAFRREESGRIHNPEFTMLEWYRPGFSDVDLMAEVDDLLRHVLQAKPAEKCSYAELFIDCLSINPLDASVSKLKNCAAQHDLEVEGELNRDDWLSFLFTHLIEIQLGLEKPIFIYDYPASQAALAKIDPGNDKIAKRFELFFQGMELANGFEELTDSQEQRRRFEANLEERRSNGQDCPSVDERFLTAVDKLPDCSGVALGIDRLLMLAIKQQNIQDVISFDSGSA